MSICEIFVAVAHI